MSDHHVMLDGTRAATFSLYERAQRLVTRREVQTLAGRMYSVGLGRDMHICTEDGEHSACSCPDPQPCVHALAARLFRAELAAKAAVRDDVRLARARRQQQHDRRDRRIGRLLDGLEVAAATIAAAALVALIGATGRGALVCFGVMLLGGATAGLLDSHRIQRSVR